MVNTTNDSYATVSSYDLSYSCFVEPPEMEKRILCHDCIMRSDTNTPISPSMQTLVLVLEYQLP